VDISRNLRIAAGATVLASVRANAQRCNQPVEQLEASLKANPDDPAINKRLIECYFETEIQATVRSPNSEETRRAEKGRYEHVLSLIEHQPQDELAGSPAAPITPFQYPDQYEQAKQLWLKQVQAHPSDVKVLVNASQFLMLGDSAKALELAERAHAIVPDGERASLYLAQLYSLESSRRTPAEQAKMAKKALELWESALPNVSPNRRFVELKGVARSAFDAGEYGKARQYAEELLAAAAAHKGEWNYGNAIHQGNLVLGRVALREGRVDEAKSRLLEAGNTTGSPQLDSFGPNMALAKELLERHQTDVVLQYLDECSKFWQTHSHELQQWKAAIQQGQVPNFGANLVY
jgi:tetratricopeptide (TPR) repeat protein